MAAVIANRMTGSEGVLQLAIGLGGRDFIPDE